MEISQNFALKFIFMQVLVKIKTEKYFENIKQLIKSKRISYELIMY